MPSHSGETCKIDRVVDERDLEAVHDALRERWSDGESLRDLEAFFNRTVLEAAMTTAGMESIDGEAANLYRLLTDDDVSAGKRIDAESRLERDGIDPDALTDDFVSYQTVRTHLNSCLGVETTREQAFGISDARNTVHKLVSRTESVTLQVLERLAGQGTLAIGSPSVTVSVRVACSTCNDEYSFSALLEEEGCSCTGE